MRPHISEKKAPSPAVRSTIRLFARLFSCALGRPARKRGVHRHGVEAGHHDVFDLGRIWRVVAFTCEARADVAAALVARADAMALIALDVEVAHFMDRLKPAQNGLIFTFESTLRIDAHESIAAMTPIRKKRCPKKTRGRARGGRREGREPFSPYGAAILNSTRKETSYMKSRDNPKFFEAE